MSRDDLIQTEGTIVSIEGGGLYRVKLDSGQEVLAKSSGKMRKFRIRVILGDYVTVGLSPYDPKHGLILFRHKDAPPKSTT